MRIKRQIIASMFLTLLLIASVLIITTTACSRLTTDTNTAEASSVETNMTETSSVETIIYSSPTIAAAQVEAHPGDKVKIPVNIIQSPGIAACRLIIEYDNEYLELQSFSYGEAFAENGEEPAKLTSPVPFTWSQLEDVTGNELFVELTFKVGKDAEISRDYPVTIRYASGDVVDIDENEVEFSLENGSIMIIN